MSMILDRPVLIDNGFHAPLSPQLLPETYKKFSATFVEYQNRQSRFMQLLEAGKRRGMTAKQTTKAILARLPEALQPHWQKVSSLILRPNQQLPEGFWDMCLFLGGRGSGKTLTGAHAIHQKVREGYKSIGIISPTAGDLKKNLIEGPSGIMQTALPGKAPKFNKSDMQLHWYAEGDDKGEPFAVANLVSAENLDRLRGPNYDFIWVDELCTILADEFWPTLLDSLRQPTQKFITLPNGEQKIIFLPPQCIITTTPKYTDNLKYVLEQEKAVIVVSSTFENTNLASESLDRYTKRAKSGSKLARQEYEGEIIDLSGDALFTEKSIKQNMIHCKTPTERKQKLQQIVQYIRMKRGEIILSVDPAITSKKSSDETGILVLGRVGRGAEAEYYILADLSRKARPEVIGGVVADAYVKFGAKLALYESNQGGDYIRSAFAAAGINVPGFKLEPYRAHQDKETRATAASVLYSDGRVHHVGHFVTLEDQMLSWIPAQSKYSPDRMDALSNGLSHLSQNSAKPTGSRFKTWRLDG